MQIPKLSKMIKKILLGILAILIIAIIGGWIYFNQHFSKSLEYEAAEPITTKQKDAKTADFNENRNAYFGDLHVHTSWSFDAFIFNVRTTPNEAYLFGKGKKISHVSGDSVQLSRPLDFMAVTDHAEYMGVMMQMQDENNPLSQLDIAKRINSQDPKVSKKAFGNVGLTIALNVPFKSLTKPEIARNTWEKTVEAADKHYQPGTFTTFPAYEWTSLLGNVTSRPLYAKNMHRNVIYKGGKVSGMPYSSFNSRNPEKLWEWMDKQRSEGIELLAIPHNANISDGKMYAMTTFNDGKIDAEYAKTRMRNEPVNEVIQIKGQSMAHPALVTNDEFANFEVFEYCFVKGDVEKMSQPEGSYVRKALKDGLAIEKETGENPYKFGFIGSTDGHNGASNFEENNNVGKAGWKDATPKDRLADTPLAKKLRKNLVAGLAGIWAKENTREALFEALERKEVFATSGSRIKMRFFSSWDYSNEILNNEDWVTTAYENGVAMGGDLKNTGKTQSPTFIVTAVKDAENANLDRIQIVKGWIDENGETQEKVFDVVWSNNRTLDANGKVHAVGNTVDLKTATYTNDIGAIALESTWEDPEFDPNVSAFYYVRVLEIPTPRWTTYDAVRTNVALPDDVDATLQERAWSSPIWYNSK
jgi:hypothetical protein